MRTVDIECMANMGRCKFAIKTAIFQSEYHKIYHNNISISISHNISQQYFNVNITTILHTDAFFISHGWLYYGSPNTNPSHQRITVTEKQPNEMSSSLNFRSKPQEQNINEVNSKRCFLKTCENILNF